MKQLLSIALSVLLFMGAKAQDNSKYEKAMTASLEKMKMAKSIEDFQAVTNTFERIANAEQKEWLPFYYAALSTITTVYLQKDQKETDKIVDKAEGYLAQAEALSENNSEIITLKAMCMGARIMVDPMTRGQKYGMEAQMLAQTARRLDDANPRPYVYMAQSAFYTPEAFGGGKKVAQELGQTAMQKFEIFKPASTLHPTWGKDQVIQLLEQCK